MANDPRAVVTNKNESLQRRSSELARTVTAAAKSLSSRPQELRGPFVMKGVPQGANPKKG